MAIASDGTWLATSGLDGSVRIWDAATGAQRAVLTGHTGLANAVAIAPDGTWLATGDSDGSVRIWDAATGEAVAMMRIEAQALACAWSRYGRWISVGGLAGLYKLQVQGSKLQILAECTES